MSVSLHRFLETGHLGPLHVGLSVNEIQTAAGLPENLAKTSRRYRFPNIWLYGGVEIWLDQSFPKICDGIWIERIGHGWYDKFKIPVGSVFAPESKKVGKRGLIFAPKHLVMPTSGMTLCFDEEWWLNAFLARQADPPTQTPYDNNEQPAPRRSD